MSGLTDIITSSDSEIRNRSLDAACAGLPLDVLLRECDELDRFRRASGNLYERVRALFFLYAIHTFHVPRAPGANTRALMPFAGYESILKRVFAEATPVGMDVSHSGWSDIFFLGMDYPEGARVVNISVDLSVSGSGAPRPPVEAYFRVIDQPVLRLVSVDLQASADITTIAEV